MRNDVISLLNKSCEHHTLCIYHPLCQLVGLVPHVVAPSGGVSAACARQEAEPWFEVTLVKIHSAEEFPHNSKIIPALVDQLGHSLSC